MSDLVKRLRETAFDLYDEGEHDCLYGEAATRIEQLEQEVTQLQVESYKANRRAELADGWRDHDKERADKAEKEAERLGAQLAAEKALADRLYEDLVHSGISMNHTILKYRKARGM